MLGHVGHREKGDHIPALEILTLIVDSQNNHFLGLIQASRLQL